MSGFLKAGQFVGGEQCHRLMAAPFEDCSLTTVLDLIPDSGEVCTGSAVSRSSGHDPLSASVTIVQTYGTIMNQQGQATGFGGCMETRVGEGGSPTNGTKRRSTGRAVRSLRSRPFAGDLSERSRS